MEVRLSVSEVVAVGGVDLRCHVTCNKCAVPDDSRIVDMGGVAVEVEIVPVLIEINFTLGWPRVTKEPLTIQVS